MFAQRMKQLRAERNITQQELADLLRSGEIQDGPLADFAAEYRAASEVFRKKDD